MQKITYYPNGASMSREFAPDLVTSDAHVARQMGKSRYGIYEPNAGGSGKKPPVYKFHNGLGDDPNPEKGRRYGSKPSLNHPEVQRKLWEEEQNNKMTTKVLSSDKFPSSPKDMPAKKEKYEPPKPKKKK